jgi:hypothetical protein
VERFIIPALVVPDSDSGPEACETSVWGLEYVVKGKNCDEGSSVGSTESVITDCCEHGISVVESGCCSGERHLSGLL